MSKKEEVKVECPAYMFNVDFILKNFDIFEGDKENENELQKTIRFRMLPGVCFDINEDEYIEQVNCSKPVIKNCMLSLNDDQMKNDLRACVLAYEIECNDSSESSPIGCYKIENLHCCFNQLKSEFDQNMAKSKDNGKVKCPQYGPPTEKTISQLAQLKNPSTNKPAGSVYFSLHITCFGPFKHNNNMSLTDGHEGFISEIELDDTNNAANDKKNQYDDSEFDEYMAQINGNSLLLRVPKDNPYLVTQIYDSCTEKTKDSLTIRGCDQQIDFQFPNNFLCCQCRQKYGKCNCNSSLTDFQQKTSCNGKSYKNNDSLPAIRGNLKYPGRFENQSVKFNVQNHSTPEDATEKYRVKQMETRNVTMQIDEKNLHKKAEGLCPISNGIMTCKKGCDDDADVFTFKINRKRVAKSGKKNEIELELRTPRGPSFEISKMETREVQVNENEFGETKKNQGKNNSKGKPELKSVKTAPAKKK